MINAPAIEANVTTSWARCRLARGTNASTSTPTQAPTKISPNGSSRPYSRLGGVISMSTETLIGGHLPRQREVAGH